MAEGEEEEEEEESEAASAVSPLRKRRKKKEPEIVVEEKKWMYSEDDLYEEIVSELTELDKIPNPPEKGKNAFAITLFCIEAAFDSRAVDFLNYAFDLFPDRDYLILTQPHTVAETSLLAKFTLAVKKPSNTFSHVLYILHRDALLDIDMFVRRAKQVDIENIQCTLTCDLDDKEQVDTAVHDAIVNPES